MQSVVLVIQQGFGARILLQTDILDTLVDAGIKVVVLTSAPNTVQKYLHSRGFEDIFVEELNAGSYKYSKESKFEQVFRNLRYFAVNTKTADDIYLMEWKDAKRQRNIKKIILLAFSWIVSRLMRYNALIMKGIIKIENYLFAPHVHDNFFKKYSPKAVVLTSIGTFDDDHYVIREAKRFGSKVISYVLSWDNTTVRGLGVNLSDRIIVWSGPMKNELIDLHRLPADIITAEGVPHYDFYVNNKSQIQNKIEISKQLNFDPDKRILFLGTKSPNGYLYNADIARIICKAICNGILPEACHLIARLHPIYFRKISNKHVFKKELNEWNELIDRYGKKCLTVDCPSMIEGELNIFMPDDEIIKLASILKNSEVVINMFSTLNIEASIFDTPTVNVSFQFDHKQPPGTKIERFNIKYDEIQTHNQRIINTNGTAVVHSADELFEKINLYLKDPQLHKSGRKQIVKSECGINLGNAGRAIGQSILSYVNSKSEITSEKITKN